MVSTHLKNVRQIGSFPQVTMKIKNIWNHHPNISWTASFLVIFGIAKSTPFLFLEPFYLRSLANLSMKVMDEIFSSFWWGHLKSLFWLWPVRMKYCWFYQLMLVVYPIIYKVLAPSKRWLGFLGISEASRVMSYVSVESFNIFNSWLLGEIALVVYGGLLP